MAPGQAGKRTQAQLVAALSQELQVNGALARQILTSIAWLIGRELQERGAVTLPRVGTFFLKRKGGRHLVKFRPSVVLKREIADPASPQKG
jgi:nucleoid DNA-binding protein